MCKIYSEKVEVSQELDKTLKKCFINHTTLYNHALTLLEKTNGITLNMLEKIIFNYIKENKIKQYLPVCLSNELYYLYKKYRHNEYKYKYLTDIQYLTFYINTYSNKSFNLIEDTIKFKKFDGTIWLNKPLPLLEDNKNIYLNLSYSCYENRYQISVHE